MPATLESELETLIDPRELTPHEGESQPDFAIRFHEAAGEAIENTDERQTAMMSAWRDAYPAGDELDQLAEEHFPKAKYRKVRDVGAFSEHEYDRPVRVKGTGERKTVRERYDRDALKAMVFNLNSPIRDTGNYPTITEGHTPDADAKQPDGSEPKQPDVLGFCGPFRLGMVGNEKPRWAIMQDEHWLPEYESKMRSLPFRSPEVYADRPIHNRIFHPVAALGSIPPALNTGMVRYRKNADGSSVAKYSACYGGAMTGMPEHTPAAGSGKTQYEADPNAGGNTGGDAVMDEQGIDAVVSKLMAALMAQDWVQFTIQKMQAEQGGRSQDATGGGNGLPPTAPQAPPSPGGMSPTPMPHPGQQPGQPPAPPMAHPHVPPPPAAAPHPGQPPQQSPHPGQPHPGQPQAQTPRTQYRHDPDAVELIDDVDSDATNGDNDVSHNPDKYSLLERENADLKAKLAAAEGQLNERLAALETKERKVTRYSRLSQLREEGFVLDPDEEVAETLAHDDATFDKHCERIVKKYQRLPVGSAMPQIFVEEHIAPRPRGNGRAPQGPAALSPAEVEQAVKYQASKGCDYDEALEYVREKKAGKTDATKVA